ncbi:MAG: hypothetical protein JWM53_845, partial [bacterium]|nr:hypothetical protein [bacterium]
MRGLLVGVLLLAAASARAADGTLDSGTTLGTGGSHEVVWTPATALPVRGPRFAPVTIDAYV